MIWPQTVHGGEKQMAKPFGYERGLVKYIVKSPLTVVGFISMYIFGGGILSVVTGVTHLFSKQSILEAITMYFLTEYLPPTSLEEVLLQVGLGTVTAGFFWYWKTAL